MGLKLAKRLVTRRFAVSKTRLSPSALPLFITFKKQKKEPADGSFTDKTDLTPRSGTGSTVIISDLFELVKTTTEFSAEVGQSSDYHPRRRVIGLYFNPPAPACKKRARAGECRVVVCDPKAYRHTSRGRKRREENKNIKKGENHSRMRVVFILKCNLLCRITEQSEKRLCL